MISPAGVTSMIFCLIVVSNAAFAFDDLLTDEPVSNQIDWSENQAVKKELGELKEPPGGVLLGGDCSDYIDLTGMILPIEVAGTTVGATNDYGPFSERPGCWRGDWNGQSCAGPDVAYKWAAPADGEYTISLCDSYWDNCLLLYRFTCPDEPEYPGDFICGIDDECYERAKLRYVHLSVGEEILIAVDGYGNNAGDYNLRIYESLISDPDSFIVQQMATFNVPGAAACVVKNGLVDWTGSYGYANILNNIPVTDTTLFLIASISKTITSVAIMQLWENGLFGLDDDIDIYLPFSVRNPQYPSTPITPRMLMAHTSSIDDNWDILNPLTSWGGDSPVPLDSLLRGYLVPGGIYFDSANYLGWGPADSVRYSNIGNSLAAYLVEVIADTFFYQYCEDSIFTPLGMDETSWFLADLNWNNIAMPYYWNGSNNEAVGQYHVPFYPSSMLRTSSLQLAQHLIAFMQHGAINGTTVLDSATVDLMTSVQYPELPSIIGDFGLAWYWKYFGTKWVCGHGGSFYGCETRMFFQPEENTGVIVLLNSRRDYLASDILLHLFEYSAGPPGFITGVVVDESSSTIDHSYAELVGFAEFDYTNPGGEYYIGALTTGMYNVRFSHPAYVETTITDIAVTLGDTTYLNVTLRSICDYVVGDVNGSGSYNGLDITYGVAFFKGGDSPTYECECGQTGAWYVAGDVNGSCNYNGLDITYGVNYLKGGAEPIPCPSCPPE